MKKENQIPKRRQSTLKFLVLFILAFLILGNLLSQSITWQRTYDGVDGLTDGAFDVCPADGDNIFIAGNTTFPPNTNHIYVMKLNKFGDSIWTRTINLGNPSGELALSITPSGDGGCVITGDAYFAYAIKIDQNGNILWSRNYGGTAKQLYSIIKTSDGGYIACGRDAGCSTDCAFVLKIDSVGNLQWQRTYEGSFIKSFEDIKESQENDGYIICGAVIQNINDRAEGLIVKLDTNGTIKWEKRYQVDVSTVPHSIVKLAEGYLIGGTCTDSVFKRSTFISKLSVEGDTSNVVIFDTQTNQYFGELEIINPNRFVIGGRKVQFNSIYGHAIIIDSTGNILTEHLYPSGDFILIRSVFPMPNGDLVFAGIADFDSVFTKEDIYVLRTDSMLNAPPVIGINGNSTILPNKYKLEQNFPNPFNPVTMIKYDIPTGNIVNVKVYDLLGREVFSSTEYKTAGSYEVRFDGTNLASGLYFYSIDAGKFRDVKKMVLLK